MTVAPAERLMTAGELLAMPDDGKLYELVQGRLFEVSPSAGFPSNVSAELIIRLGTFAHQHKLGRLTGEDGGYRLRRDPDTVRAPDVGFIRAERLQDGRVPNTYIEGAPDLAVEILSPTSRIADQLEKAAEYIAAGARLVWVLDPIERFAIVVRPGGPPSIVRADGQLDGEDVIPGFSVKLAEILD